MYSTAWRAISSSLGVVPDHPPPHPSIPTPPPPCLPALAPGLSAPAPLTPPSTRPLPPTVQAASSI